MFFFCLTYNLNSQLNNSNIQTQCRRPQTFQTMNSVRSNNLSLKYQRFTTSDSEDIGIKKFEFLFQFL